MSIQLPTDFDNLIVYQGIVNVDTLDKQIDLYNKSREWVVNTFVSSKAVLELDDKSGGILIGKGSAVYPIQADGLLWGTALQDITVNFSIKIDCKQGKYQFKIYNLSGAFYGPSSRISINYEKDYQIYRLGITPKGWNNKIYFKHNDQRLLGLDIKIKNLIQSLSKAMNPRVTSSDF